MLELFIDSEFKLRQLRSCPVGEHLDGFAKRLHSAGYRRRPAQLILRGAAHLPYNAQVLGALLLAATTLFFGLSWTRGGQTPGMRAWRLQLRRTDGGPVRWPAALSRFAFAFLAWLPLGAGVLWCAIDARRRAWHDALSGTEVVLLPRS